MARAFISIGSNVDRERHIALAVRLMSERYGTLQVSSVYESESVGFQGDPFFNLVAAFDTSEQPTKIIATLRDIERRCGRERTGSRFGSRTLDLDLLLLDDAVVSDNSLVLPRKEITHEAFVLCPLAEIAGERRHPVIGDPLADLWARFDERRAKLRKVDFDPRIEIDP